MSISEAIESVVSEIEPGYIFDSHFVIKQLIKRDSDSYLRFCCQYADSNEVTLTAHQQIGQEIKKFDNNLVKRQGFESWSENIHSKASKCAAWKRI